MNGLRRNEDDTGLISWYQKKIFIHQVMRKFEMHTFRFVTVILRILYTVRHSKKDRQVKWVTIFFYEWADQNKQHINFSAIKNILWLLQ